MVPENEGESGDATTDGELVPAMSSAEKTLFTFAFVILLASLAGFSVFLSLESAGKKEATTEQRKAHERPDDQPTVPRSTQSDTRDTTDN